MVHRLMCLVGNEQVIDERPSVKNAGTRVQHTQVFRVFHIDENLNNCRPANLKTVCLNCAAILGKEGITWRQGDLVADY
jgi:hypothetical protein